MPIVLNTVSVTGDCKNNSSGALYVEPGGGFGPYQLEWVSPPLGIFNGTAFTQTNLVAGHYSINIINSLAPTPETETFNLFVSSGFCVNSSTIDTTCNQNNGFFSVTANSFTLLTYYYLYSFNDGYLTSGTSNTNQYQFGNLSAGTYYAIVADEGGCSATTSSCIIHGSTDFDFDLFVVNNSNCGAGNAGRVYVNNESGGGPYTYSWNNTLDNVRSITGLSAGIYTVTVTNSYGCSKTKEAQVINTPTLSVTGFMLEPPTCFASDGKITAMISGGSGSYYYYLSNGDYRTSTSTSEIFENLSAGIYTLTVYDGGQCTASGSTSLLTLDSFSIVEITPTPSNCGGSDGIITIIVKNGSKPYTFKLIDSLGVTKEITSDSTVAVFNGLSSGIYHVEISNPSACFYETDVILINQDKFTITTNTTNSTCESNNGSISISASTPGLYSYYIDTNNILNVSLTSVTFNNLVSDVYNVRVVDSTGCEQKQVVSISTTPKLNFSLFPKGCGLGSDGTITALITSGQPPFTFEWSPNVGAQTGVYITNLSAGNYTLKLTDSNGCSLTKFVDITCPQRVYSYESYEICEGNFVEQNLTKRGFSQMLNQGYHDLIEGDINCKLQTAKFKLNVDVGGTAYTKTFFTTTSLDTVPSDDDYVSSLENLLESIPGIGAVIIDKNANSVKINTDCGKNLNGKEVKVDIIIDYDICCQTPLLCVGVFCSINGDPINADFISGGTINDFPYWVGRIGNCVVEIYYNSTTKRWETNGFNSSCASSVGESYSYFGLYGEWGNDNGYTFRVDLVRNCCKNPILNNFFGSCVKLEVQPIFEQISPACAGVPFSLPNTSINGVIGVWDPIEDYTQTKVYKFIPNLGQNAVYAYMTVERDTC